MGRKWGEREGGREGGKRQYKDGKCICCCFAVSHQLELDMVSAQLHRLAEVDKPRSSNGRAIIVELRYV